MSSCRFNVERCVSHIYQLGLLFDYHCKSVLVSVLVFFDQVWCKSDFKGLSAY